VEVLDGGGIGGPHAVGAAAVAEVVVAVLASCGVAEVEVGGGVGDVALRAGCGRGGHEGGSGSEEELQNMAVNEIWDEENVR
jgi:hypothetical protein